MSGGLFADLARARFLGHPIHMMLVHFPMGLWPAAFVFDLLGRILNNPALASAAFFSLLGGIIGAALAMIFGAMDYFRIPPEHRAWKTASIHAGLNLTWLMLFAVLWGVRLKPYPNVELAGTGWLILCGLGVIGLLVSAHLGGELVLRHGVGVINERSA